MHYSRIPKPDPNAIFDFGSSLTQPKPENQNPTPPETKKSLTRATSNEKFAMFAVSLSWQNFWSKLVDIASSLFFILLLLTCATNISSVLQSWNWTRNEFICKDPKQCDNDTKNDFIKTDCQFLFPLLYLIMVVGICLDNGTSWSGRIFRLKPLQFLGKISFPLYLVQSNIIQLVSRYVYYSWGDIKRSKSLLINIGAVPVDILIAILVATILTYCIEEPMRKILSKKFLK